MDNKGQFLKMIISSHPRIFDTPCLKIRIYEECFKIEESTPSDSWKHPVESFRPENGVYYKIHFLGSYPVNISIKTVEYKNRMKIARECIKRVSAELGINLPSNKPPDRDVISSIGNKAHECGKISVWLRITTETISMLNQQKTEELKRHNLQDVSFACGGDQELLEYLSYVAKDPEIGRYCFVFQSIKEAAKDIIMSIGQAFDLRFREYQRALLGNNLVESKNGVQDGVLAQSNQKENEWGFRPISNQDEVQNLTTLQSRKNISQPIKSVPVPPTTTAAGIGQSKPLPPTVPLAVQSADTIGPISKQTVPSHCPLNESWYLGPLSRSQAEKLLKFDGDFLVRDSTQQPNQYVLSGKQNGQFKHLLLVDPEGKVHTKDREFTSIKHLIEFHQQNKLPIASMDSELHLLYPIQLRSADQPRI